MRSILFVLLLAPSLLSAKTTCEGVDLGEHISLSYECPAHSMLCESIAEDIAALPDRIDIVKRNDLGEEVERINYWPGRGTSTLGPQMGLNIGDLYKILKDRRVFLEQIRRDCEISN